MKNFSFLIALVALFTYFAAPVEARTGYEKCYVTGPNGETLIKPGMGDKDPEAKDQDPTPWIWVPMGKCNQINRGDFTGVEDLQDKINS